MEQRVLPGQLEELAGLYRLADERVERFLLDRPELVRILSEGRPHIERLFGKDTIVVLRHPNYIIEYEGDTNGEGDVFMVIHTPLDAQSARDAEQGLWDEWFGEVSADPNSWPLYIDVEYAGDPPAFH